jgi:hypothetical protein
MPLSKEFIERIDRVQKGNREAIESADRLPPITDRDIERSAQIIDRALRQAREEGRAEGRRERFW